MTADPSIPLAIAIAARDEAGEVQGCLNAVAASLAGGPPAWVVLLANNCGDATAEIAGAHPIASTGRLRVIEAQLPPTLAHAGGARRMAGAQARDLVGAGGLILFTDADSRPAIDWAAQMRAGLQNADVVCGRVVLPPGAFAARDAVVDARMAVEGGYLALTRRFIAAVDPDPDNPWPNHGCESGCNFGMTARAWDAVGGVPAIPLAEDRATMAAARAAGLRVRLLDGPQVLTSARRQGRAPGGMADALAMQDRDPDPRLDELAEPPEALALRHAVRARLRADGAGGWLTAAVGLTPAQIAALEGMPFGRAWAQIEACPALARIRMTTSSAQAAMPRLQALTDAAEAGRFDFWSNPLQVIA